MAVALMLSTQAIAQPVIVTTCVGSGVSGNMGDGGPAIAARISFPVSVALDAAANLYVADYGNNVVRKVTPAGIISTVAGWADCTGYSGDGGPATNGLFSEVFCLAADGAGNLYISDQSNNVIRKVDAAGTITTFAGNGIAGAGGDGVPATAAMLSYPTAVVADNSGNVFIADAGNFVIRKVSPAGIISTVAGTMDSSGYTGNDGPATAAHLGYVYGMTLDRHGNLFIGEWDYSASPAHGHIRKIDAAGTITLVAGKDTIDTWTEGIAADDLYLASLGPVHIDDSDRLYFVMENRLCSLSSDGRVHIAAGTGIQGFGGDGGSPLYANFFEINGIAHDVMGNLYLADSYNDRIRKIGRKTVTGITTVDNETIGVICPNPSKGSFTVSGLQAAGGLNVYDMAGRVVHRQEISPQHADIVLSSSLPQGIYLVHINSGAASIYRKLYLQR